MEKSTDDVSKIHDRYTLTLFSPTSKYMSLTGSLIISTIIVALVSFYLIKDDLFLIRLAFVLPVLLITQYIDSRYVRNKDYSKCLHVSWSGNLLWLVIISLGLLSGWVLGNESGLFYLIVGMFIFASFRIGLFTTVLGLKIKKAWAVCMIQPLPILLALILPEENWSNVLFGIEEWIVGVAFLAIATLWSVLTDRAGRPWIESTHNLVQAYIASQSKNFTEIESIIETKAKFSEVKTSQIKMISPSNKEVSIVIPEIHPGPYHPIGGSNIPYLIYESLGESALVLHSISDHSLNLPSRNQVDEYLKNLSKENLSEEENSVTEPVTVQINKARVVGILFGKTVLMLLSLSPHGMEDLPVQVKTEIEQYAKNRKYSRVLIADCHNAMGKEISNEDSQDMLKAAKSCLDTLITKDKYPCEFGYANTSKMNLELPDLGKGGLGIVCLKINNKKYFLGWSDSNNMENGVREKIVADFEANNKSLLEICTSDTHYTPVKARNKNGYYQFGLITDSEKISRWFLDIATEAEKEIIPGKFKIVESNTKVKVMGPKIFEDLGKTLDKSMIITKIMLILSVGIFVTSLFLTR